MFCCRFTWRDLAVVGSHVVRFFSRRVGLHGGCSSTVERAGLFPVQRREKNINLA